MGPDPVLVTAIAFPWWNRSVSVTQSQTAADESNGRGYSLMRRLFIVLFTSRR